MTASIGPRAEALHAGLSKGVTDVGVLALIDEAARIADRLDNLDSIIAGKGVLNLMRFRVADVFDSDEGKNVSVEVRFDWVLSEARQQANAFRQILVTLGVDKVERVAPEKKGTALDELANRRKTGGRPDPKVQPRTELAAK